MEHSTPPRTEHDSQSPNSGSLDVVVLSYAATVFLSAFLLFQVQPLVSKFILPWFGGSPAVWTAAMLFFQMVLFAGYLYAHLTSSYLKPRGQFIGHCLLLALALGAVLVTRITPLDSMRPTGEAGESPLLQVLLLLGATVGIPYFCLSATGPLLQKWFSDAFEGASPYRLFALSNLGSLLALLSYPLFFEVYWGNRTLALIWSGGFVVFAVVCAVSAAWTYRARCKADLQVQHHLAETTHAMQDAPTWLERASWVALPTLASAMFLATTNEVCQNIATVPLLWIVPLSLYLVSFIIAFDHPRWYSRKIYTAAAVIVLFLVAGYGEVFDFVSEELNHLLSRPVDNEIDLAAMWWLESLVYFLGLFLVVVICHGELALRKPSPRYLTSYYLTMSLGGAIGGLVINLCAPQVFSTFFEFPLGLLASLIVAVLLGLFASQNMAWRVSFAVVGLVAIVCTVNWRIVDAIVPSQSKTKKVLHEARNFYGTVRVQLRSIGKADEEITFYSGHIQHGKQLTNPQLRGTPLTYYGEGSGCAVALNYLRDKSPKCHIGIVGLGIGTLATYAREGDTIRFYEINPQVLEIARNTEWFHFLSDCRAKQEIVLGDARLQLERELRSAGSHQFDFLCIDAFSGDAIPAHLITNEAFALYKEHLHPQGILAIHITNTYLDLYPVVKKLAEHHGFKYTRIARAGNDDLLYSNDYLLLTHNAAFLAATPPEIADLPRFKSREQEVSLWTDEYNNLMQLLR